MDYNVKVEHFTSKQNAHCLVISDTVASLDDVIYMRVVYTWTMFIPATSI